MRRSMFNVDILFNDKTSADFFGKRATIDDIISSVVSNRFNEKMELNLSNFCNDPEFFRTKIHFYKLFLLSNFKILMLRMGRDTKILNLSNNKLDQVPLHILNFFIKGDLIGLNLSYNDIPSIQEQFRVSSKIEKLWLEGNPLCDEMDPGSYIKQILIKFPRLTELDGIKINQHGILYPFSKQFSVTPDRRTKLVVEKFLTHYFSHYDTSPRTKIEMFYDIAAVLTISINLPEHDAQGLVHYACNSRNALNPAQRVLIERKQRMFTGRKNIVAVLSRFPETEHDLNTFTLDVMQHDNKHMVLVLNGIFKEKSVNSQDNYIQFTRTFVFSVYKIHSTYAYHITNEMFSVTLANPEQKENSFKCPMKHYNGLRLLNPSEMESETICRMFMHLTMLRKEEAERRLKDRNWDIRLALMDFVNDMKISKITNENIMEVEDDYLEHHCRESPSEYLGQKRRKKDRCV
ncbi:unnamed protein product, partial [Iphiclides podalirius]